MMMMRQHHPARSHTWMWWTTRIVVCWCRCGYCYCYCYCWWWWWPCCDGAKKPGGCCRLPSIVARGDSGADLTRPVATPTASTVHIRKPVSFSSSLHQYRLMEVEKVEQGKLLCQPMLASQSGQNKSSSMVVAFPDGAHPVLFFCSLNEDKFSVQ